MDTNSRRRAAEAVLAVVVFLVVLFLLSACSYTNVDLYADIQVWANEQCGEKNAALFDEAP